MLIKLLCYILGHKFMVKAFNGRKNRIQDAMGFDYDVQYYNIQAVKYCQRCGKKNPNYEEVKK